MLASALSVALPPPPNPGGAADYGLEQLLTQAGALVAHAATFSMALDQIGIELPPAHAEKIDQAQLRAIASLYLASELENAGLISAVETLAGLLRSAALNLDVGAATPLLLSFWQARNRHATREERMHSFAILFQDEGGGGFEDAMLSLCEALYKLDENISNASYGGMAQQLRVRAAASRLLAQLLGVSGGMTVFMAQEILQSLRAAIDILKHHDVLAALGSRDVWSAMNRIQQITHTPQRQARLYLQRGKAGMTVLSWLAEAAPLLDQQGGVLVKLDHPVIPAAIDWMQSALSISEADSAPAGAPLTGSSAPSSWSALAA